MMVKHMAARDVNSNSLLDASTVTNSLNALPGFKTSAGKLMRTIFLVQNIVSILSINSSVAVVLLLLSPGQPRSVVFRPCCPRL